MFYLKGLFWKFLVGLRMAVFFFFCCSDLKEETKDIVLIVCEDEQFFSKKFNFDERTIAWKEEGL